MICRNCKFSLQGSEKFCPNCGAPLSEMTKDVTNDTASLPEPPRIFFTPVKNEEAKGNYTEQDDISSDGKPTPKKRQKQKSSSKAPVALMLLLLLVILTTALVVAAERFDVAPAIMQYLKADTSTTYAEPLHTDYQKNSGTISPDINYSPTVAYVSKNNSLSLRHGPDNSYGLIMTLRSGCHLQILGGTSLNERWIYVYVPFYDCYGWLNASFITLGEALEEATEGTEETEEAETNEEETSASQTQQASQEQQATQ